MKKIWIFVFAFLFMGTLAACDGNVTLPTDLTIPTNITIDDLTTIEPTTEEITPATTESDLVVQLKYIYNLAVEAEAFDGTYEEWLETVRGPEGTDGREVTFQVADGYIQWQYVGDSTWTNLLALSSLVGPPGEDGEDGKSAYDIYMENFPEYEGDEEQWIIDLINGDLTVTKTYTVTFDSDGGSAVASQDVLDGDKATRPTDPTRVGYTFLGWFVNDNEAWVFGGFVITEDTTLKAKWEANQYDLIFKDYNGEDLIVSQPYLSEISAPPEPVKDGYTFLGWFDDLNSDIPYVFDTMPLDGVTLYPVWDINQYTITFEENGGTDVQDITQDYLSEITEPVEPTQAGYLFMGWFEDSGLENPFEFTTMPLDGATLYAKWVPMEITISFEANGGSETDDLVVEYNQTIVEPEDLTRPGYTFLGWYEDSGISLLFDFSSMPLTDITLYAGWKINEYDIVLKDYDDSGDLIITQPYLSQVTAPSDPSKEGYIFLGWFEDLNSDTAYVFDTMPLDGVVLYPKWEAIIYTITFDEGGGTLVDDIQTTYMSEITLPVTSRDGYTFLGWYVVDADPMEAFTEGVMPAKDVDLFAYWQVNYYDAVFKDYNEDGDLILNVSYDSALNPPTDPTKVGYTFLGWFEDLNSDTAYVFDLVPLGGITLYPKWQVNTYTITLDENGGSDVDDVTAPYLSEIIVPTPIRDGYIFDGWYLTNSFAIEFLETQMPHYDITLFAKWAPAPAVIHFKLDFVDIPDLIAAVGDTFELPQPIWEAYSFVGWYEDDAFTTPVTWSEVPAGETTLYGLWEPEVYMITYEENGGSEVNNEMHFYLDELEMPEEPIWTDHLFLGWYEDAAFTIPFIFDTMPAMDLTLYAKWVDITDPNLIYNQISQPSGSLVTIEGIVYGTMRDGILGYFIYDVTGAVAIDADHSNLNIGDLVEVQGTLIKDGGLAFVSNVTQVTVIQQNQAIPTPVVLDLADLHLLNEDANFKVFHIEGVLVYDEVNFMVFDPDSLNYIVINPDSIPLAAAIIFSENAGSMISMDMVYSDFGGFVTASLINYSLTPLTVAEQGAILEYIINTHLDLNVFPGQQIPLDQLWILDLVDLTYTVPMEYLVYFDPVNLVFLETEAEVEIPFTFTLDIDSIQTTFTINVTLHPLNISTISDVIDDTTMSMHTIEALVVMKNEMSMLLKDDTGYLYAYPLPQVQVGDLISLDVINDLTHPVPFIDFVDGDMIYNGTLSSGNPLGLNLNIMSSSDFLALDQNDVHLNGEYVELRGFVRGGYNEAYHGWVLENDDWTIPLMTVSHSSFEKLFDYDGLEVYIRGFLMQDEQGHFTIIYEGIRGDIRIPEYTDQEVVDVLEKLFYYMFEGHTFNAFENFEIPPFHPILGGDISWSFDDPNFAYFDFDRMEFLYSDTDQPFAITINVTYGTASKTIHYSSQLNHMTTTAFADLLTMDTYQPVFVEGVVVFHSPNFVFLMNDLGEIIKIQGYNLNIYTGDDVLIYGELSRDYSYNQAIYIQSEYYDEDDRMVLEIYSRQNSFTLPEFNIEVDDVLMIDVPDALNNHIYVNIEGLLTYDGSQYLLETPFGYIVIEYPYEQVFFDLQPFSDQFVNIKGYLLGQSYNYSSGEKDWTMMVVGEPGDITPIIQTEAEIFTEVESSVRAYYQSTFFGGETIDFIDPIFFYPDVTITYLPLDDTDGLFDFSSSYIQTIPLISLPTDINIQVDLELNGESHSFVFTISLLPTQPIIPTPINQLITDGQTVQYIQGQVVMVSMTEYNSYILTIDDGTGFIFITMPESLYRSTTEYYNGYINDEVLISGLVTLNNARIDMAAETMTVMDLSLAETLSFTPISIEDYTNIDLTDPTQYGVGYEITGKLSVESSPNGMIYYLDDGQQTIRLILKTVSYSSIKNLEGIIITVRALSYGPDPSGMMSVLYDDRSYDSTPSVWVTGYDDQAAFELIKMMMIDDLNEWNPQHYPDDYIWYPSIPNEIIDAFDPIISYDVVQGGEWVLDNGNALIVQAAPEDVVVVVEVSVNINGFVGTFKLHYYINGYTVQTLDDLFDTTPGTDEIALEAVVVNSNFGLHYLLIEGQIYTLRSFTYGGYSMGENVIILGQRRVIDGVSDYTYNIQIIPQYTTTVLNITPIETDIEFLYENDYTTNPINQDVHRLEGFLTYDPYSDLFILTNNTDSVYVRMLQEGWNYDEYLKPYIGEYVSIDVLLPLEMMRGQSIYIVDAFGPSSVQLKSYTAEEDVALIKNRLLENTVVDVYSGGRIDDYIQSEWALHPYTYITYTFVNPLDEIYYDLDNEIFAQVSVDTQIELVATIHYDDFSGNTASDTVQLTINIHPRQYTSILDVMYGQTYETYMVSGVIVALGMDQGNEYDYAIISDGTYQIYVGFNNVPYNTFDGENITLNIGDSIDVIASRGSYDANGSVAALMDPTIITVNSTGNTVSMTPINMSVEDVLSQSFTDLTNFYQYVTITGELYWTYSYTNPSFTILSDLSFDRQVDLAYISDSSVVTILEGLSGQNVAVTGYLLSYYTLGSVDWVFIYESHEVITE